MATPSYDLNVHLMLATTAALEGDFASAFRFLTEANRLARAADRRTRARVLLQSLRLRMRQPMLLPALAY